MYSVTIMYIVDYVQQMSYFTNEVKRFIFLLKVLCTGWHLIRFSGSEVCHFNFL